MTVEATVILPVYNGEQFIKSNVVELDQFLREKLPGAEILVVDDGSTDGTAAALQSICLPRVRSITAPKNRGKFGALKLGMMSSEAPVRMFLDADLPFDLRVIPYAYNLVKSGFHVVMGDRTLTESRTTIPRSLPRRVASWAFATAVRQLLTGGLFDTQCGFKAFHGPAGAELFRLIQTDSFAGDAELLYLALKFNLAIRRIPVLFVRDNPSSIHLLRDSTIMLQQAIKVPANWYGGRYRSKLLEELGRQSYWANS